MIRKESIKRLISEVIHKRVEESLSDLGFKYAKSKSQFSKTHNKFKQIISISHYNATVEFDEQNDQIQLHFSIASAIELPRFEKWCEKEYDQKHRIYHQVNHFKYFYNLSEHELNLLETFTSSKSRQFKTNVSRALAGNRKEKSIPFKEIEEFGFVHYQSNLDLFCDTKILYENRRNKNDLSYIRMLEYLEETEFAKSENIISLNVWKENLKTIEFKTISDRNLALTNYNKRVNLINERFSTSIEQWNETFKQFEVGRHSLPNPHSETIKFTQIVSILNPSSKILRYHSIGEHLLQIREDGSIIRHRKDGEILSTINVQGFAKIVPYSVSKSEDGSILYVANTVIKEERYLYLNYNSNIEDNGSIKPIPFSQVSFDKRNQFAFLISNFKKHELHFCDSEGNHISKIDLPIRPIEIIPSLEIVLCEKQDKSCEVYGIDGEFRYSMPSNNARYSLRKGYDYNLESDLFLSGWYYTKSQLFNLSSGKLVKHLWAHPTNINGYKEKLYSDINHNFGMGTFKFSPKGDYVIGGADHGKYVAWTTNNCQRYELIPNEQYLSRLENAEVIDLDGHKMLKNRGNHMGSILFFENGKYFGFQIKKDILIWDNEFNHLETILDFGYINQINSELLLAENEGTYTITKNHCD